MHASTFFMENKYHLQSMPLFILHNVESQCLFGEDASYDGLFKKYKADSIGPVRLNDQIPNISIFQTVPPQGSGFFFAFFGGSL